MQRSIATVCLSGNLAEKLQAAASAHFEAVEVFENDLLYFDGSPREVRALADSLGLKVNLYQPFRDFEGVPSELFKRNLERAERKFDIMHELGAPALLVCSNVSAAAMSDRAMIVDQLAELAERAGRRGLTIAYEALSWGAHVRHVGQVWDIVKAIDHPHLGVCLDSFHMLALGDDPALIETIPGDKIAFVQIADAPKMTLDPLTWSRHYRCFPGQGEFDLAGFMASTLRAGYMGPLSLEIFNDEFRGASNRATAHDGFRSLQWLEDQTRLRLEADAQDARAEGRPPPRGPNVALFSPPPPARLDGLSFIEFACGDPERETLGAWIKAFGFDYAGAHKTKAVDLYRSGGVNIVLNAEPDSFARAYYLLHGPSICAIGLRTADDLQALGRATAFHCQRFASQAGPNELSIPSIRAPDGALIYFVSEAVESAGLYEIEFNIEGAAEEAGRAGGLDRVDHVAMALPQDQMNAWVLYYRAVLGLEPKATMVLPDPYGLVRSRAMADKDRTVRFPLNIAMGRNTTTAQSIAAQHGAGVHHVAFGCRGLLDLVESLREAGAPLLHIPDNYYEDLALRFDLPEALIERMRRLGVLYDRQGEGEFLHVYTEPFQGRFFFEFVERLGGYDDYGAVNAPARMAAHSRLMREGAAVEA